MSLISVFMCVEIQIISFNDTIHSSLIIGNTEHRQYKNGYTLAAMVFRSSDRVNFKALHHEA